MEDIIKKMIEKAVVCYREENHDEADELIGFARDLIDKMADTVNCPGNWRSIREELAQEYQENSWVSDALGLHSHEECSVPVKGYRQRADYYAEKYGIVEYTVNRNKMVYYANYPAYIAEPRRTYKIVVNLDVMKEESRTLLKRWNRLGNRNMYK